MVENVRWGLYHQPTEKTVKKMMANADAVLGNPLVAELVDRARIEFGRENHFDVPAKLNTLVHKLHTTFVAGSTLFLVRWIFAHMLAKRVKDPFSDRELGGKAGVVAQVSLAVVVRGPPLAGARGDLCKAGVGCSSWRGPGQREAKPLGAVQELPSGSVGFA